MTEDEDDIEAERRALRFAAAEKATHRWRTAWRTAYLLLVAAGILLWGTPLPTLSESGGPVAVAVWHVFLIVGGAAATIGLATRRPFFEITGALLANVSLGAYIVALVSLWVKVNRFWLLVPDDPIDYVYRAWMDANRAWLVGFSLVILVPVLLLAYRVVELWHMPEEKR